MLIIWKFPKRIPDRTKSHCGPHAARMFWDSYYRHCGTRTSDCGNSYWGRE